MGIVSVTRTRLKSGEVVPAMRQVVIYITLGTFLSAQNPPAQPPSSGQTSSSSRETIAKPMTEKQRKKNEAKLKKELETPYKRWLNEDVAYIITDEERKAFKRLSTDDERESFIEDFWLRRDPTPDTEENEYREEHYRRIAYANDRFASGIPGWKTDRGRIYIAYGPPDEIDSHPSGGTYERPYEEGGGSTSTYPFEQWRYRYIEGVGTNIILEFVDTTMSGEYRLTMDPSEKDALLYVPGAGLTMAEQMGLTDKTARFTRTDGTHDAAPLGMTPETMNEFTRLELYSKIQQAPPVKFKDLEAVVSSRLVRDQVKFQYRTDFLRITSETVLVPITIQIPTRQLSFQQKSGVESASVNLFCRVTSLSSRIVNTFEDNVRRDVPSALLQQSLATASIYQKAIPLSPGLYRLDIVLKDTNNGNVGVVNTRLAVPRFEDDSL